MHRPQKTIYDRLQCKYTKLSTKCHRIENFARITQLEEEKKLTQLEDGKSLFNYTTHHTDTRITWQC